MGLHTILKEKQLSIDGDVNQYPNIWKIIKFH